MKILSLICVVIVLVLNGVPCADSYESKEVHAAAELAGDQHRPAHTDECTPFCHCSCCANTVVVRLISFPAIPFKTNNFSYIPHFAGTALDVNLPIFQPPKLV